MFTKIISTIRNWFLTDDERAVAKYFPTKNQFEMYQEYIGHEFKYKTPKRHRMDDNLEYTINFMVRGEVSISIWSTSKEYANLPMTYPPILRLYGPLYHCNVIT